MKTKQVERKGTYLRAFRAAFPYTVPVLTGYLFIGMAFGVMIQEKGYNFLWAMLMSLVIYAGSGQYLAVNFFAPGVSLLNVIFMEFMVNIRHIFYGLSLLERFSKMGKKRLYMIFSLTDETYALYCSLEYPKIWIIIRSCLISHGSAVPTGWLERWQEHCWGRSFPLILRVWTSV